MAGVDRVGEYEKPWREEGRCKAAPLPLPERRELKAPLVLIRVGCCELYLTCARESAFATDWKRNETPG